MDHKDAVRLQATERYLLNELDPDQLDQFEEHLFDCPECALDIRAGAMFVEQSKNILAEPDTLAQEVRATKPSKRATEPSKSWFAWLRPAFALPVTALLLLVVGYQNLVEFPGIRGKAVLPEVMPSVTMNVATRGADVPVISARQGQDFSLLLNMPPDGALASYIADLYNAAGTVKWSLAIPADAVVNDSVSVRVPGNRLAGGTYVLAVRGVPRDGGNPAEIGRHSFELRLQ